MWGQIIRSPLARGMTAYAIIWPLSSYTQQRIAGKPHSKVDWARVARFSIYGSCYVAPTLFLWVRLSSRLFPGTGLRIAIKKALIEQVSYGPFAVASFFSILTLMEGGSATDAIAQVQQKFLPTWKVGCLVWPVAQTINFTLVPERNRIGYVAICSLMWTSFLAYTKYREEHPPITLIQH